MNANPYSVYPRTAPAKKASKAPLVVLVVVLVLAAVSLSMSASRRMA